MYVHEPAICMWTFSGSTDIRETGEERRALDTAKAFFHVCAIIPVEELGYLPVTMTSWFIALCHMQGDKLLAPEWLGLESSNSV